MVWTAFGTGMAFGFFIGVIVMSIVIIGRSTDDNNDLIYDQEYINRHLKGANKIDD